MPMNFRIEFDAKIRIALIAYENEVTESTLMAGFQAIAAFAAENSVEGIITDFSKVTGTDISAAFVRRLADSNPVIAPGKPSVIVAPQAVMFGMARVFQTLRERDGTDNVVVRSLQDALKLMGLEGCEFTPMG